MLGALVTLLAEHAARIHNLPRLATLLDVLADWFQLAFRRCGELFARLSGFLEWLKLHEIGYTLVELAHPLGEILFSWAYFFKGYGEAMLEYAHPGALLLGSVLLLLCADQVLAQLRKRRSLVGWAVNVVYEMLMDDNAVYEIVLDDGRPAQNIARPAAIPVRTLDSEDDSRQEAGPTPRPRTQHSPARQRKQRESSTREF